MAKTKKKKASSFRARIQKKHPGQSLGVQWDKARKRVRHRQGLERQAAGS